LKTAARVAVIYLSLMVAVWFGYQVWQATQLHALDCILISDTQLFCQPVPPLTGLPDRQF